MLTSVSAGLAHGENHKGSVKAIRMTTTSVPQEYLVKHPEPLVSRPGQGGQTGGFERPEYEEKGCAKNRQTGTQLWYQQLWRVCDSSNCLVRGSHRVGVTR